MASTTVRISQQGRVMLKKLARQTSRPMQAVLDDAIEQYRRRRFLEEANAAYDRLRKDAKAWKEELAERRQWEATLSDGNKRN